MKKTILFMTTLMALMTTVNAEKITKDKLKGKFDTCNGTLIYDGVNYGLIPYQGKEVINKNKKIIFEKDKIIFRFHGKANEMVLENKITKEKGYINKVKIIETNSRLHYGQKIKYFIFKEYKDGIDENFIDVCYNN